MAAVTVKAGRAPSGASFTIFHFTAKSRSPRPKTLGIPEPRAFPIAMSGKSMLTSTPSKRPYWMTKLFVSWRRFGYADFWRM